MPRFPTYKITVSKTLYHPDLAEEYHRPDVDKGPCKFFAKGQEFIVEHLVQRPEGFSCN